jgi:hypothetical protein
MPPVWGSLDPLTGVPMEVPEETSGKFGRIVDALGSGIANTVAFPRRYMDAGILDPEAATQWAAPMALGMLGAGRIPGAVPEGAVGSSGGQIRAYHGSPFDFDRFEAARIGSGEGAGSYGHGLYFAENPKVAEGYRDRLAPSRSILPPEIAGLSDDARRALMAHTNSSKTAEEAAKFAQYMSSDLRGIDRSKLADLVSGIRDAQRGRMYEVNIKAQPGEFLDWDKPISQQSDAVREIGRGWGERPITYGEMRDSFLNPMEALTTGTQLKVVRPEHFFGEGSIDQAAMRDYLRDDPARLSKIEALQNAYRARVEPRGEELYRVLAGDGEFGGLTSAPHTVDAAETLRDAGLAGIKYLDQWSRKPMGISGLQTRLDILRQDIARAAAGGGGDLNAMRAKAATLEKQMQEPPQTSNYVVFDPDRVDILRKWMLPGMIGGGAAWGSLAPRSD